MGKKVKNPEVGWRAIMKRFHNTSVKVEHVPAPASGVKVRWLITEETGAPNFAMRQFTVAPGGYTPRHIHPWEHEAFILSGEGVVIGEDGEEQISPGDVVFVPQDEEHQFRNTGDEELRFLCLIPHQKK
jgi:quercetin dioxygenase-like cupin family protein